MDITLHEGILAAHVAGAVAWIGAVLAFEVLGVRVRNRAIAEEAVMFASDHAFFTRAVALPGSIALLLTGGWLMHDAGLEIGEAWWLGTGIGAWVVAFL